MVKSRTPHDAHELRHARAARGSTAEPAEAPGWCGACGVGICSPEEALGVGTASVGSTAGGIVGCCIGGSRTDEIEEDRGAAGGVGSGALE